MEKSVNKVELKGNVGQDPKIVNVEGGGIMAKFSLATHESYKTKSGEWKEETVWHTIVAWSGKSMPDFEKIRKGSFLEVTGKLRYARYRAQSGEERNITEIHAVRIVIPLEQAL